MRVLLVSNTYPPDLSGVASLVQEMARRLGAEGHEVVVLTRDNAQREPEPFLDGVSGGKGRFPLIAGLRYWRSSRRQPFDLIHVHESDGAFVVFAHRLQRWLRMAAGRARLMATLQVSYDEEIRQIVPVHLRNDRDDGPPVSMPTAEEAKSRRRAKVHAFLGRRIVRLADRVIAPSHKTVGELETDYGARDVAVIYNGIDVEGVRRAEGSTADGRQGRVHILYTGRLRTRKAVAVLLHAFQNVIARGLDAELSLVGGGPQEAALHALHRDLFARHPERVSFRGQLDRDATLEAYASADIYCIPSLYEGFPLAILEAMAAGLPVVATNVSGNPEAVADGTTGLLVEPRDAEGLADALASLIEDPDRRRAMGAAGRRRVEEHFTIEKIVQDHLRLCEDLISDTTTPPERTR